ncbi:hypothetical protein IF1G_06622 [Cordyceps javanica]|uniref:DRBM domain-containing protein n=1 Tax=Cordyceps javanica TaxID=43265 RepID=A0A545UYQ9_9HYPO|nr:hypothetical protein IF1G_06622 [Cordyceps javanica]TQW06484.1 vta1 like domain-containing protein [Cordyceps javanica]
MAPITKPSGLSPLIPVPWAGVRAWLDEAEATQAATGGATMHLTHAQLLALSQLASFCAAEPALPKEDHVSKLMRMSSLSSSSSSSPSSVLAAAATGTGVAVIQDDYPGAAAVDTAAATPVAAEEEEEEEKEEADGADAADPMEGVVRFANGPELTQARHLEPPIFTMSDPVDVPFRGAFQLRWHCVCVLPWCGKSFPAREEGRAPALFSNKKDAKQYAAMLALAYLNNATRELTMSHTPRETPRKVETPKPSTQQALPKLQQQQAPPSQAPPSQDVPSQPDQPEQQPPSSPSKPPALPVPAREAASPPNRLKRPLGSSTTSEPDESSPPKQRHRSRSSSPLQPPATPPAAAVEPSPAPPSASASACASTPARTPTLAPEPAPFVSPKGRGADAAAEQKQLFDEIHRLCARLGVSQPTYRLTQDPDRPSFFSGHAEFSAGSRVPDGIAVVRDVLGKRQTRIQIAQQILKWMEEEEARRKQRVDAMLS